MKIRKCSQNFPRMRKVIPVKSCLANSDRKSSSPQVLVIELTKKERHDNAVTLSMSLVHPR